MSGANVDNVFDRVETKVKGLLDENAQLREQNRVLASLLAKAQPHVCSALCPSVKRDGDLWTHKDLCAHMEAALTATSQPTAAEVHQRMFDHGDATSQEGQHEAAN